MLGKTEDPKEQRYRLGFVARSETKVTTLPFSQALNRSLEQNKKYSLLILELAKKIVQGKVSLQSCLRSDRYRPGRGLRGAAKRLDSADGVDGRDQPQPRHL